MAQFRTRQQALAARRRIERRRVAVAVVLLVAALVAGWLSNGLSGRPDVVITSLAPEQAPMPVAAGER